MQTIILDLVHWECGEAQYGITLKYRTNLWTTINWCCHGDPKQEWSYKVQTEYTKSEQNLQYAASITLARYTNAGPVHARAITLVIPSKVLYSIIIYFSPYIKNTLVKLHYKNDFHHCFREKTVFTTNITWINRMGKIVKLRTQLLTTHTYSSTTTHTCVPNY